MNEDSSVSMRRLSLLLGGLVGLVAFTALVAWELGNPVLTGSPPMMPRTALGLLLLGGALWGLQEGSGPGRQRLGWVLAGAALAVGLVSLGEHLYAWRLELARGPWQGPWWSVPFAGRPHLLTALSMILCALSLLTLEARPVRGLRPAGFLAGLLLVVVFANFLGYLYGVSLLISRAAFLGMVPRCMGLFFLLGIALFLARPKEGLVAQLASPTLAGFVLRSVGLVPLVVPTLVGWLRLQGEELGLFEERTGILILVLISTVLSLLVLWGAACLLERTEGELRKSQEEFKDAFEYAAIGIALTDLQGGFQRVNRAFSRMLGYSAAELQGRSLGDLTYPEDVEPESARWQQMLAGEFDFFRLEQRYLRRDGQVIWGQLSLSLVRDLGGKPLHVIAEVEDVTARKEAEEEASRLTREVELQARRLDEILSASPTAILVFDDQRHVTFANPVALKLLGIEASALLGKTWQAAGLSREHMPTLVRQLRESFATGRTLSGESPFPTPGGIRYFSYVFSPLPVGASDHPVHTVLLTVVDITERRRAEDALRKSQADLARAQEIAHVGSWKWYPDTDELELSAEIFRILRIPPERQPLPFAWFLGFLEPPERARLLQLRERLMRELAPAGFEHRIVRSNGEELYVYLRGEPVLDADGRLQYVEGISQDITERKRMEEVLRQANESLRALIEAAPVGIHRCTPDQIVETWNPAAEKIFGWSEAEVVGRRISDFVVPDEQAAEFQAFWTRLLAGEVLSGLEAWRCRRDGSRVEISLSAAPLRSADGKVSAIMSVVQDITERKRAEEGLRQSEARLARAQEVARIGSWELDIATGEVVWSDESYRLFGYAPGAFPITYEAFLQFVRPEDRPMVRERVERAIGEGLPYSADFRIRRKDGVERIVHGEGEVLRDASGKAVRMVGTIQDITELREALEAGARRQIELEMEQARELARLKDLFLSTISHEMKTPLSLITGYGELLQEKYPMEPLMEGLLEGARRLSEHVTNMVDYSALLSGSLPIYPTELDLRELVENVREMEAEEFRKHGLTFVTLVDPGTPVISADPRRMVQILREILENARAYTSPGGTVGVRVEPCGEEVRLRVWDTGCGIPVEQIDKIWEAFHRIERGGQAFKGGLGLGLTIVRKLTELHGGRVEIKSKVDEGTTIDVYLPQQLQAPLPKVPGGEARITFLPGAPSVHPKP